MKTDDPIPDKKSGSQAPDRTSPVTSGFVPLRYRFILITSLMLLILLTTLALVLGFLQTRTIRDRIKKQGLSISENLAAVALDHLLTYNYVALEKLANQAAKTPNIVSVIIHDKEGKIAGYSRRPDLQNRFLTDSISIEAVNMAAPGILIRTPEAGKHPVMDVAVPVYLPGTKDRWGTIRVCMSLDLMYQQIRQTRWSIFILGTVALIIGIFVSNWSAQRVTKPLDTLVNATVEAAQGNLDQTISIRTKDEVEILAANFSNMIREILSQKRQLEDHLNEIRQLQQYAEEILSTMHDGLLAVDMDGCITAANPAAHQILDLPGDNAVIGRHAASLFKEENPLACHIEKALKNPSNTNPRELCININNMERTILAAQGVLLTETGLPRQIIFTLSDITAIKQLEAEIRQNQRLADLGTLAAGMAHEIRNPLSAIKTYVALLPRKIDNPDFLDKFKRTVPREINRLNTLIEELLELSRVPKYSFKKTDVKLLLEQSLDLLDADFKSRGIQCQCEIDRSLPQIMADPDQLEKVFINLLQNSGQAMPEGGTIRISARPNAAGIEMVFQDQGSGFSPETAQNLFNPFFTTRAKGTGLGLAITHKIITEHGGQIKAESQTGKGSCFTIHLPENRALNPAP